MSTIETTVTCTHEWHEDDQPDDDFHHCTRPAGHTGPHTCGWCEELGRT